MSDRPASREPRACGNVAAMAFVPSLTLDPSLDPARARYFAVAKRGLVVAADEASPRARLATEAELAAAGARLDERHVLGSEDGGAVFAVEVPDEERLAAAGLRVLGIRNLVEAFDEATFALAGRASHVLDWATTHRFCGRCGSTAERSRTERCMQCPKCGLHMYPRISPAVIVLVRRGEEALLARNARFPLPFYSTLAGFSDIGESLEATLAREIREEVGVEITNARYFGSQPWPFPNSLMIAFTAEWASGEIAVDHDEIADAQWFTREALPLVPPPLSIARRMIDAWLNERR